MTQSNRPDPVPANETAAPATQLSPDEWIERLAELESAKKRALMTFDADLYETSAREQSRLVQSGVPDLRRLPRECARSFALSARLNSALLLNLFSISPHFALAVQAYGPSGAASDSPPAHETLRVEA